MNVHRLFTFHDTINMINMREGLPTKNRLSTLVYALSLFIELKDLRTLFLYIWYILLFNFTIVSVSCSLAIFVSS